MQKSELFGPIQAFLLPELSLKGLASLRGTWS